MPRNFKLPFPLKLKDPRLAMRAIVGTLLLANVVAAIVAFKPFGGSADDLRREQASLRAQVARTQQQIAMTRELVSKVDKARTQGNDFLAKYFTELNATAAMILTELDTAAKQAGIRMGQAQWTPKPIEGSDTLQLLSTSVGFEGTYANLTKFVNLLDKSPRFMIIENFQAAAPQQQGGQTVNVSLKIDTFVKESAAP
jgi:type IV pilus assembly protein PilO